MVEAHPYTNSKVLTLFLFLFIVVIGTVSSDPQLTIQGIEEQQEEIEQYIDIKIQKCKKEKNEEVKKSDPLPLPSKKQQEDRKKKADQRSMDIEYWLPENGQARFYETEYFPDPPYQELPFCIVAMTGPALHSALQMDYSRKKIIVSQNLIPLVNSTMQQVTPANSTKMMESIQQLKKELDMNCGRNDLIILADGQIPANCATELNFIHQQRSAWATFHRQSSSSFQVFSFYKRIFNVFEMDQEKVKKLQNVSMGVSISLGVMQLTKYHQQQMGSEWQQFSWARVTEEEYGKLGSEMLALYDPMIKLSQDYKVNISALRDKFRMYFVNRIKSQSTITKILWGVQNQQLLYLPSSHSLGQREIAKYSKVHGIGGEESQVPLCLTIMSHNNVANNRYKRAIQSALAQNYTNFQIVFIDDMSDDQTLNATRQILIEWGFPSQRLSLIRNLKKKFATYNIVHAAFEYCHPDSIQVLLDGDDELAGRQVFKLINGFYQKEKQPWICYSDYYDSYYRIGLSRGFYSDSSLISNGIRRPGHYISPTRTWKSELVRRIPLNHHQFDNGTWFDTVYDEALQHPLFEMARIQRTTYTPQATYLYNVGYGDNDDSTGAKVQHRQVAYTQFVLKRKPLEKAHDLQQPFDNKQIRSIFESERNIDFEVIDL